MLEWIGAVVLLGYLTAGFVGPQTDSASPTQLNPGVIDSSEKTIVITGCVSGSRESVETFLITDSRLSPPKQYRLEADRSVLKFHIGHTIEVRGPVVPSPEGARMPTVKARSIIYLAESCIAISKP